MSKDTIFFSTPERPPDIVLPKSSKECKVGLFLEERLMDVSWAGTSVSKVTCPWSDYPVDIDKYISLTLKNYDESDPRVQAIQMYYADRILLDLE